MNSFVSHKDSIKINKIKFKKNLGKSPRQRISNIYFIKYSVPRWVGEGGKFWGREDRRDNTVHRVLTLIVDDKWSIPGNPYAPTNLAKNNPRALPSVIHPPPPQKNEVPGPDKQHGR